MTDVLMGLLGVLFGLMLLWTLRTVGVKAQWDDVRERPPGDQ